MFKISHNFNFIYLIIFNALYLNVLCFRHNYDGIGYDTYYHAFKYVHELAITQNTVKYIPGNFDAEQIFPFQPRTYYTIIIWH